MSNLQRRRRSDVWSPELPASKPYTIYVPSCFAKFWARPDEAFKRQVNRLLLEMMKADKPHTRGMTADDL